MNLQKLAASHDTSQDAPELPAVFVGEDTGKELEEKGIKLVGSEFSGMKLNKAVYSVATKIGSAQNPSVDEKREFFKAAGQALLEAEIDRVKKEKEKKESANRLAPPV